MCGIVVYYGDAENRLTRIFTGMWAIIYRAPDSTGIGLLGNDLEPLKIRRELGSVENLIDSLLEDPVFDDTEAMTLTALKDSPRQNELAAFEGFTLPDAPEYPRWSQLTDTRQVMILHPGTPGNPKNSGSLSRRFS